MDSSPPYGCPTEGCIEKYPKPADLASHMAFSSAPGHDWENYASAANALVQRGLAPNEPPLAKYVVSDPEAPGRDPLNDETPTEEVENTEPSYEDRESNPLFDMPEMSHDSDAERCPRCSDRMHGVAKGQVFDVEFRNGTKMAKMDGTERKCDSCNLLKDESGKKVEILQ